jgi:chorismate dehydratase
MLRLGHIRYSNCFPVHARFVHKAPPPGVRLVFGVPSHLNDLLARGLIDVAPSSSIEYARHGNRYRLLPNVVIGSCGAVRSILLVGAPPDTLDGGVVALPTASATSVVLLKILLRTRWRVTPRFIWFDQASTDPFALGAAAALYIGDIALRRDLHPHAPARVDLGAEWYAETGLPFAFALWQARGGSTPALRALSTALVDSYAYWRERRASGLQFELDAPMVEGVRAFYRLAAEVGVVTTTPPLVWI